MSLQECWLGLSTKQLCQGNDGAGHILLECTHADMEKQHIARHDAMMRMLIKEFTKGSKGSHYLIADVGTVDTLKDLGVHSCQTLRFSTQHKTLNLAITFLLAE